MGEILKRADILEVIEDKKNSESERLIYLALDLLVERGKHGFDAVKIDLCDYEPEMAYELFKILTKKLRARGYYTRDCSYYNDYRIWRLIVSTKPLRGKFTREPTHFLDYYEDDGYIRYKPCKIIIFLKYIYLRFKRKWNTRF